MSRLTKAEFKKLEREGRVRELAMDEKVDLEALSKGGKTPAFHTFREKLYLEIDPAVPLMSSVRDPFQPGLRILKSGENDVMDRLRCSLMPTQDDSVERDISEIEEIAASLPQDKRRSTLQKGFDRAQRIANARFKYDELTLRLERAQETSTNARTRVDVMKHILKICDDPKLQRLVETGWHKCNAELLSGEIHVIPELEITDHDLGDAHSFVIQHDWAAAFANAQDFHDGDYRLPFDRAIFEFRISGSRVCFNTDADKGHPVTAGIYVETPHGWALANVMRFDHGHWHPQHGMFAIDLINLCADQVRAVSIALGAEVAETEIVRAPHKLNAKREKAGKLPILDYHIINLSTRKRYARRLAEPGDVEVEHRQRRLHFVRGHDRHYPNHKIWIEWHLRGNSDLGFIDKEYRL